MEKKKNSTKDRSSLVTGDNPGQPWPSSVTMRLVGLIVLGLFLWATTDNTTGTNREDNVPTVRSRTHMPIV